METILIVEDELIVARDIRRTLERAGHRVSGVARSAEKALDLLQEEKPTLVLVDIFLKGTITGIELAAQLNLEGLPFIYISANSNQLILEAAKTTNPYGFVVKPFREKDLLVSIDIARHRYENNRQMMPVAGPAPVQASTPVKNKQAACENMIGTSSAMLHMYQRIQQVAPFNTSVLLLGESGTGKEGAADCIVQQSQRHLKPFIKVNCAALPSGLMEAEFFGYEKGAFTGATDKKAGKFEQANGGTILLDEIGELPIDMQAKLLRVLQNGEIQRIGSNTTIKTDVRIIASTNRNLEKEVGEGKFRLDLYYRLHIFPISLSPLRERKDDIPLLVQHFLRFYATKNGHTPKNITDNVLQQLAAYDWPGNVRELQHLIERTILLTADDTIETVTLPEVSKLVTAQAAEEGEREKLLAALQQCNFKISGKGGAAALLNMPPATLYAKVKKLGITKGYI